MSTKIGALTEATLASVKENGYLIVSTGTKSYKLRVSAIEPFSMTVDSALSTTSTNPVQNSVIKTELDKKMTKFSGPVGSSIQPIYFDSNAQPKACSFTLEYTGDNAKVKITKV